MIYAEYAPAVGDTKGLGLPDRQSWRVLVGQNRDSDPLSRSNFTCALESLGGEGDHVEVCRFGHWLVGWIEIILINPEHEPTVKIADDIESALADYPVLDEMHWSNLEHEELCEWAEQVVQSAAHYNDIELQESYCVSWVLRHFDQWTYDDGQPDDDEIAAFLIESGHGVKEE
tara:strand:+ start:694 stop:1212 length:519 start_codon:yes stop_codon:yes gene_type:complete